ncbi:MAG: ABC transporter substrate-binding protein [Pseudomonadota bacterium]|nr:ABC transporter substrate-binding protein [Pseudomonadota bacterium]
MKRRNVLAGICALAVTGAADAQRSAPIPKIGVVTIGVAASSPYFEAFRQGLREHGYIEGKNIAFEYRFAQGQADRLAGMAADLVRLNVNVIVTESTPAALAASRATKNIPIVMAIGTDPVKVGLAASLARPGGNVTGLTLAGAARTAKQLQLLKEMAPGTATVAVIHNAARPGIEDELTEAAETARSLGLALHLVAVRSPEDLNAAFDAVASAGPSALMTIGDGMLLGNSKRIVDFALKSRLPGVFPEREFAEAGGLMSYGPDIGSSFRRAASFVDKILKGAKPADLPIEQPTKWGLVVNLKTAKALGLKIPGSVLVRADEVIQ